MLPMQRSNTGKQYFMQWSVLSQRMLHLQGDLKLETQFTFKYTNTLCFRIVAPTYMVNLSVHLNLTLFASPVTHGERINKLIINLHFT